MYFFDFHFNVIYNKTSYLAGGTILRRKLFKGGNKFLKRLQNGGNYSKEDTIQGNTVYTFYNMDSI